ncbi:hypothetical protein CXG81DRAFT_28800 [Caulochytrium protostelioides]|uniref:Uncharacterized protein n=1 Tax=Caulochytrium protostelioides TaxID=1555241 RepID=A0A4P9X0X2_9FUNG|nr:hypothetical protein CXG81DRAFT_28800 [Caulochytrium protostelioides]|eukprot:RKO98358.1 hypothetical protein CXG81DRAFT_28800 [Caulochytrium protostelioides]
MKRIPKNEFIKLLAKVHADPKHQGTIWVTFKRLTADAPPPVSPAAIKRVGHQLQAKEAIPTQTWPLLFRLVLSKKEYSTVIEPQDVAAFYQTYCRIIKDHVIPCLPRTTAHAKPAKASDAVLSTRVATKTAERAQRAAQRSKGARLKAKKLAARAAAAATAAASTSADAAPAAGPAASRTAAPSKSTNKANDKVKAPAKSKAAAKAKAKAAPSAAGASAAASGSSSKRRAV